MKYLRVFYYYYLKKKWHFFGSITLLIFAVFAETSTNFIFREITQNIQGNNIQAVVNLILLLFGILVLALFLSQIAKVLLDACLINASVEMRQDVMKKIHELDYAYHVKRSPGSLISAFKRGDGSLFSLTSELNEGLTRLIVEFIILMITFSTLDLRLALAVLLVALLSVFTSYFFIRVNLQARKEYNKIDDRVAGIIADNMTNFETVKYFTNEGYEAERMKEKLKEWRFRIWKFSYTFRFVDITTSIITAIGIVTSLLLGVYLLDNQIIDLPDFVLIITFSTAFFPKVNSFVFRIRQIFKNLADLERYASILNEDIKVKEITNPEKLRLNGGSIEFKNVYFDYEDRKNIINGVSLNINPGESVAFVGESGAGKSTLAKLLLRFYDLNKGEINIDGQNIANLTKKSLRSNIGIVPQEAIMFNDTFLYNLTYGNKDATKDEVEKALKVTKLKALVDDLPKGLNTIVGERGIKLSGGQRLAIARLFLENPPIVIFDEATSQLDSESEKVIQEAFWKLAKNKTVIIIAHRLSTILKSDRIVVLKDGKIIEKGNHQELIKKKGYYNKLWSMQKGNVISD